MSRIRMFLVLLLLLPVAACGDEEPQESGSDAGGSCEYVAEGTPAKEVDPPPSDPVPAEELTVTTNLGDLTFTLATDDAPCTTWSFTSLAEQGYFDGTDCHRLTTAGIFVLQCGDPTGTGAGGPGYRFADELAGDETYPAGTLAMANAGPDTNGSQFFIVYEDTELAPAYTVFGTVDEAGLELVREAAKAGSDETNGPGDGVPNTPVTIESVEEP